EQLTAACPASADAKLVDGESAVGGGAFPGAVLPTTLVSIAPGPIGPDGLALRLRLGAPAVVARIAEGRVMLDPRTLPLATYADLGRALVLAYDDAEPVA